MLESFYHAQSTATVEEKACLQVIISGQQLSVKGHNNFLRSEQMNRVFYK